jgi:5-(carboxyamino)imidazole ribonucleotide mutase
MTPQQSQNRIAICMGSQSDWSTMKEAAKILDDLGALFEVKIISAHRTPARLTKFAETAHQDGFAVIIAGAGGAAHLPGMLAAHTHLPVLGVPVESAALKGMDSLLSIVQMPGGVPVGTLAIGAAGAKNAALMAIQILAISDPALRQKIIDWRQAQTDSVADQPE